MKQSITSYVREMDDFLKSKKKKTKEDLQRHLQWISFYQHERLIHLIVTFFFALFSLLTFFYLLDHISIPFGLLELLFLGLTIPYIFHYYTLENNVQKMYQQYEMLSNQIDKN